jgi:hypothetical protein
MLKFILLVTFTSSFCMQLGLASEIETIELNMVVDKFVISENGKRVAIVENIYDPLCPLRIRLYDTEKKRFIGKPIETCSVDQLFLSKDGTKVFFKKSSWRGSSFYVYDIETGVKVFFYEKEDLNYSHYDCAMAMSDDNSRLLISGPGIGKIFNLKTDEIKTITYGGYRSIFLSKSNMFVLATRKNFSSDYFDSLYLIDSITGETIKKEAANPGFDLISYREENSLLLGDGIYDSESLEFLQRNATPYETSNYMSFARVHRHRESEINIIIKKSSWQEPMSWKTVKLNQFTSAECLNPSEDLCFLGSIIGSTQTSLSNTMITTYVVDSERDKFYPFRLGYPVVVDLDTGNILEYIDLRGGKARIDQFQISKNGNTFASVIHHYQDVSRLLRYSFMIFKVK